MKDLIKKKNGEKVIDFMEITIEGIDILSNTTYIEYLTA
jgi:hypothetical protein